MAGSMLYVYSIWILICVIARDFFVRSSHTVTLISLSDLLFLKWYYIHACKLIHGHTCTGLLIWGGPFLAHRNSPFSGGLCNHNWPA